MPTSNATRTIVTPSQKKWRGFVELSVYEKMLATLYQTSQVLLAVCQGLAGWHVCYEVTLVLEGGDGLYICS